MYEVKTALRRKGKTRIMGAAFLLAAVLTGCAGGDVQPEQKTADQVQNLTDGENQGWDTTVESQTPDQTAEPTDIPALSYSPTASPKPSVEPFVDKLTEEGIGWGLGFGESGQQPTGNASPEELAQYDAFFMGDDSEKVIYLTFDCGYENGNTEAILDALKVHGAPGTFFVVGHYLESAPELVQRMVEEGHAVGNHTYHHYDINTVEAETFKEELKAVEELFYEITGTELSPYYRPPEGKCGIINLRLAQEQGYNTIFWSLAHVDWDTENQPSHEAAMDKLTGRIHPGAVVLLHNTSRTNGEILDELLTKWEEMGYTFAPLSDLIR